MAVKTITITEEAYRKISSMKMPDESFSDLFKRIASEKNNLSRLLGILPAGGAEEDRKKLKAYKEKSSILAEEKHEHQKQKAY